MAEPTRLHVATAAAYDVVVGHGVLGELPAQLGDDVRRVAVAHAAELPEITERVLAALPAGVEVLRLPLPDGEAAKTAAVATDAWERLGAAGFTRSDALVTVGGGATTDLGGFIAATWLRGVPVVHVPTTLLAMVDAAVGGKTGINTGAGKNLVGAFHEPAGVLCDLELLVSLPRAELVAGMAEVVKCGFVADPEILRLVEADPEAALDPASPTLRTLVERAIAVKAEVVAGDLRETGGRDGHPGREVLNYGHTMGHALERHSDYRLRHGEAVALGMVYVASLARRAGLLDAATADRHRSVLELLGLPVTTRDAPGFDEALATMRVDKKSRGATLRFVVLDALASPRVLAGPDDALLREAYDELQGVA